MNEEKGNETVKTRRTEGRRQRKLNITSTLSDNSRFARRQEDQHSPLFQSAVSPCVLLQRIAVNPYPANVDNMASSYQC